MSGGFTCTDLSSGDILEGKKKQSEHLINVRCHTVEMKLLLINLLGGKMKEFKCINPFFFEQGLRGTIKTVNAVDMLCCLESEYMKISIYFFLLKIADGFLMAYSDTNSIFFFP